LPQLLLASQSAVFCFVQTINPPTRNGGTLGVRITLQGAKIKQIVLRRQVPHGYSYFGQEWMAAVDLLLVDFFGPQTPLAYRLDAMSQGPKKLSNSRAQPPPTCPRNGCWPHQKHYARGRLNHYR
jgi:hypothetical protein